MENYRRIETDAEGNIVKHYLMPVHDIPIFPVLSHEIIPKGCDIYAQAFIVDKMDVAVCDGKDTWYAGSSNNVRSAKAGQPWAALFG